MADRLTLTRALEEAGMSSANADRITTEIYDAIHDNVATKQDLRELEQRIVIRLGTLAVVLLTLLFGALHLWPPK
jgi:hypothetical protein